LSSHQRGLIPQVTCDCRSSSSLFLSLVHYFGSGYASPFFLFSSSAERCRAPRVESYVSMFRVRVRHASASRHTCFSGGTTAAFLLFRLPATHALPRPGKDASFGSLATRSNFVCFSLVTCTVHNVLYQILRHNFTKRLVRHTNCLSAQHSKYILICVIPDVQITYSLFLAPTDRGRRSCHRGLCSLVDCDLARLEHVDFAGELFSSTSRSWFAPGLGTY
jgi:hypothetical protein